MPIEPLPNGMTLYTIGYACLKYPELDPEFPVPFGNQLGGLQRLPITQAHRVMPQIASQYLSALLAYQYDREAAPLVFDITSSQYYLSDALCLINYLTSNPDAAVTVAKHPRLLTDVVEKILAPGFEERMRAAPRNMGSTTFEGDLGTVLQFVSTLLLCPDHIPDSTKPLLRQLLPLLKTWKTRYSGNFIAKVADRLADQIKHPDPGMISAMRSMQLSQLRCAARGCGLRENMKACSACNVTRYCTVEHQKADWKFHKKVCMKGLVEE